MSHSPDDQQSTEGSVLAALRAFIPERPATFLEALRISEQQAHRLLQRFGVTKAPVSEDMLLRMPSIAIHYIHAIPTSGCSFWDREHGSWIIQLNADEPETRQRLTLFHEYKHIVDHGHTAVLYGTGEDAAKQAEQAADYFAGCVLMPRPLLKRAWGEGLQTAERLAEAFDVSPAAATVRLRQVGIEDDAADSRSRLTTRRHPGSSLPPGRQSRTYFRAMPRLGAAL